MGDWASGGFLLEGETDGIQTTALPSLCANTDILIRLGHSFGLVVDKHFVVI